MTVDPVVRHPSCVPPGWPFPSAGLPHIGGAVPAVDSGYPDITWTGSRYPSLY